jgi:hypothetical protein
MRRKPRKQFRLDERQDRLLKREAERQGVSQSELIRRALDGRATQPVRGGSDPGALDVLLTLARDRAAQGPLPGQRDWQRADLYEERLKRCLR